MTQDRLTEIFRSLRGWRETMLNMGCTMDEIDQALADMINEERAGD